jgi:hypothetical protein
MRRKLSRRGGVSRMTFAALALTVSATKANAASSAKELAVESTTDLGPLGKPANVIGRDGGESALIGGKLLWTFGDTMFPRRAEDGSQYRTNTAALADPERPLEVSEPLDANGAPLQAIPFIDEELKYNKATGKPDDRIALWTGGVAPLDADHGLAFFSIVHVGKGMYNYTSRGIGTAAFAAGDTQAKRNEGALFTADEPGFARTLVHNGMLYLYGGLPGHKSQGFGIARAPLAQATERSAYEFWNGSAWTTDVRATVMVFDSIPGGVTASYNEHLGHFLAIHSGLLVSDVRGRTAPKPEGPWSEPKVLFKAQETKGGWCYAALEHPELAKDGGKRIFVTYSRPLDTPLHGELRLVEVELK